MGSDRLLKLRQLVAIRRDYLQTDAAHLVGRFLAPHDTHGRPARIAFVRSGVVVAHGRLEAGALRQRDELLEAISLLPGEVPIADREQGFDRTIGERAP